MLAVGHGYVLSNTYDYSVKRGENQQTGEIIEDITAKVSQFVRLEYTWENIPE
jgi:hypothetical protein